MNILTRQRSADHTFLGFVLVVLTLLVSLPLQATILYENAENGETTGWRVYDDTPEGATISNVYDEEKESQVILLNGSGIDNGYILGDVSGQMAWNNTSDTILRWSMQFNQDFAIYISINTQKGQRYLSYSAPPQSEQSVDIQEYFHHYLPDDTNNGSWHGIIRDLQADLVDYESDNTILSVAGFLIRGSGKIDDIELRDRTPLNTSIYKSEIIVRTLNNFSNHSSVTSFIKLVAQNHISTISIAFKQDEDDETRSGELFYTSSIAPSVQGYGDADILADVIQQAHNRGIKVKAWIPQCHDQVAYTKNPAWRMMTYTNGTLHPLDNDGTQYFVNPIHHEVQEYEISIVKEIVSKYDIDGVVLDWIRFDNYNMDLSEYTRNKFRAVYGYDPIIIDFTTENPERATWVSWRNNEIGVYITKVKEAIQLIKPELSLGVYALSPSWKEIGQDPATFHESIDFISPMCYYQDWGYPVNWVYGSRSDSILLQTKNKMQGKEIIPSFDTDWDISVYTDIFSNLRILYPDIKTISWFKYGTWTAKALRRVNKMSRIGSDAPPLQEKVRLPSVLFLAL